MTFRMDPAHWPLLHTAAANLAASCDYAIDRDGAGFSAADAAIGHHLGETPITDWDNDYAVAARALLPTYRRQLGADIADAIAALPTPPEGDRIDARAAVRADRREEQDRRWRKAKSWIRIDEDNTQITLAFPYDEDLVAAGRSIPGRRYDPEHKANIYPLSSIAAVIGLADQAGIDVPPEILAVAREVQADPEAFTPPNNVTLVDDAENATLRIETDYDRDLNTALRSLAGRSTWNARLRVHEIAIAAGAAPLLELIGTFTLRCSAEARTALAEAVTAQANQGGGTADLTSSGAALTITPTALTAEAMHARLRGLTGSTVNRKTLLPWPLHVEPAKVRALLDELGFTITDKAAHALDAHARRQAHNLTASTASTAPPVALTTLAPSRTLMPHQAAGVRWCTASRRVIIADEMGLGKTITSLAAIEYDHALPVVIACKADLTENWRAEISATFPHWSVHLAAGMTTGEIPAGTDAIVISFDALRSRKGSAPKQPRFVWVDTLAATEPRALIIDEGHLGKEATAQRSQALAALATAVTSRDGLVLNLTGTPLVNRPKELAQQLITLGLLAPKDTPVDPAQHLFGGEWDFLFRYCGPERSPGGYGWTFKSASNALELNERLRAWGVMLRRTDAVLDLPSFTLDTLQLDPSELDQDLLEQYRNRENTVASDLAAEAHAYAADMGLSITDPRVREQMGRNSGEHLVRLTELRTLIGAAKRPAIAAWARAQIAAGEKVMIAAQFRDTVDQLAGEFGGLKIQGGQTVTTKEQHKYRFQNEPLSLAPAITVSIGAGGAGHTLTAARIGIQAELCWSPGEVAQMAKRMHRIGQDRPTTYLVSLVAGTVDEKMWDMICDKKRALDAIIDGKAVPASDSDEATAAAELAWALALKGLAAIESSASAAPSSTS